MNQHSSIGIIRRHVDGDDNNKRHKCLPVVKNDIKYTLDKAIEAWHYESCSQLVFNDLERLKKIEELLSGCIYDGERELSADDFMGIDSLSECERIRDVVRMNIERIKEENDKMELA